MFSWMNERPYLVAILALSVVALAGNVGIVRELWGANKVMEETIRVNKESAAEMSNYAERIMSSYIKAGTNNNSRVLRP